MPAPPDGEHHVLMPGSRQCQLSSHALTTSSSNLFPFLSSDAKLLFDDTLPNTEHALVKLHRRISIMNPHFYFVPDFDRNAGILQLDNRMLRVKNCELSLF